MVQLLKLVMFYFLHRGSQAWEPDFTGSWWKLTLFLQVSIKTRTSSILNKWLDFFGGRGVVNAVYVDMHTAIAQLQRKVNRRIGQNKNVY